MKLTGRSFVPRFAGLALSLALVAAPPSTRALPAPAAPPSPTTLAAWLEAARLAASDRAAGDMFGVSIAIDGGVVVVGAYFANPDNVGDAGAAYAYTRPAGGWAGDLAQSAKLTTPDKAAGDYFGHSVAISGDVIVVGVDGADPGGTAEAGAAYVFVKPAGGWAGALTPAAKLTASDKAAGDYFGASVAVSGDVVVVGAQYANPGGTGDAGAAYVFVRPAGGWAGFLTESVKLSAPDKAPDDHFGRSVAISGDVVAVGAPGVDAGGTAGAGAAYVFTEPAGGWAGDPPSPAKLFASIKGENDAFGWSAAAGGDMVAVGAAYADLGGTGNTGAAYVFPRPAGGWVGLLVESARLSPSDRRADDYFGQSVAISGDTILVGAPNADLAGTGNAGAAYVFPRPAGGWTGDLAESARLSASDMAPDAVFGGSVAMSGSIIAIGAHGAQPGGLMLAGAAYVWTPEYRHVYLPVVVRGF